MGEKNRGGHLKQIVKTNDIQNKLKKESIANYLNLADSIIVSLDNEGIITLLNKKGYEILGYNDGELIGKNWFETCLPIENMEEVKDVFNKLMNGQEKLVEYYENPIIQKDGIQRFISWHNTLLKDDNGQVIGVFSSGNDITEQKQTKEMLKASEERFISLANLLPEACFEADLNGNIFFANQVTFNLFGYSQNDIDKGIALSSLISPEENIKILDNINKILYGDDLGWVEYKAIKKNGSYFPIISHTTSIIHNGKTIGLRGILIDITERKMAEEVLRENEENYRTLFKSISDAVFVIDQKTRKFVDINDAALDIYGYSRDEWAKMKITDISTDPEKTKEIIKELPSIVPSSYHIKKDETIFPVEMTLNSFKLGRRRFIIATGRDITERLKAEEKIVTTKEYLQNVINSASEIIITFDKKFKVTTWNKTAEYISGYKQKEIIGKTINKLDIFENHEELIDVINNINRGLKTINDEIILKTKQGTKKIIKPSYSSIRSSSKDFIGILFVGKDITFEREIHGKMLRGNSYLITDRNHTSAITLFKNLTKTGYEGLLITRGNPELIKSMIPSKDIIIKLLDQIKLGGFDNILNLEELKSKINEYCINNKNALILLDRVDYLITNFSFDSFIKCFYQINSIISETNSILLLNLDPSIVDPKQIAIIENELQMLPHQKIEHIQINDNLYDILTYIYKKNQNNTLVSFTNVSNKFSIVRPTTAKRIIELENKGLISIKKRGRLKTLYITDKGKTLLNKRKIL